MNSNTAARRTIRRTAIATAIIAASVVTTAPAFAQDDKGESGSGQVNTWTVPFDAIGGLTMAQYVAEHEASRLRSVV